MTTVYENGEIPEIALRHRLMIARVERGMSQAELAQLIGVSRTSISNAENGTTVPRRIVVNAWALATGVPATWLLTGAAASGPDGGDDGCPHQGSNLGPAD